MSFLNVLRKITPKFVLNFYHFLWAFLSALICGFPSKKIKVIGITGTDGKTTTAEMIYMILTEAGYKTALFSSIKIKVGEKEEKNMYKMTMPGRGATQRFLKRAVEEKCQYAIVEITSEGIVQYRHRFIDFEAAVFTNLNKEHLERHGGFENYRNAKLELFKTAKENHIINIDDKNSEFFIRIFSKRKWLYGIDDLDSLVLDFNHISKEVLIAKDLEFSENGTSFFVNNKKIKLNLLGKFNVYNSLAAISLAMSQGISLDLCASGLAKVKNVSGRMEIVSKSPLIFVDYAHTPNALTNVYETVSNFKKDNSRLICVLGSAGGGRDKWKRKELGRIADNFCDFAILTNEDPYDENPEEIIKEIEVGFQKITEADFLKKEQKYEKVLDRKEAIGKAVLMAGPNDIICITGKGREPLMCVENGKKIKWDDREIVEEFLKTI
jgi:UDP-N-acetylmuramoyl-L-alanyl-D-glutamate--2,6-diaminopimelate ligase